MAMAHMVLLVLVVHLIRERNTIIYMRTSNADLIKLQYVVLLTLNGNTLGERITSIAISAVTDRLVIVDSTFCTQSTRPNTGINTPLVRA